MYTISADDESEDQIDALPHDALVWFAEVRAMLEVAPWNGPAYNSRKPDSPMRSVPFGPDSQGMVIYLIVDDLRRVDLLRVVWAG